MLSNDWLDVSIHGLPTKAQEVLIVRGGRTVSAAWIGDSFWYSNERCAALYWMPLPPPPSVKDVKLSQEPYAYIDDKNRLVKISGHVYFDGGFVDANSEIPDSWKTLVLVEKVGA